MVDYNKPAPFEIGAVEGPSVVGYDPEMADATNPRGAIGGTSWTLVAQDAKGNCRVYDETFRDCDEAHRVLATMDGWSPLSASWLDINPVYGSEAYIEADTEYLDAQREYEDRWVL